MIKDLDSETEKLYYSILEGLFNKKGKEVIEINLVNVENSICKYFIICHGDSNTQVRAITESIEEKVNEYLNISAWHKEGLENMQWVLLDYIDIIVHIFQKPFRDYYNLEDLWADGKIKRLEDVGNFKKLIKTNG